ncbi:hypothetical protein Bbelb_375990 [Branchiostoma belcheri]|nr:hypothetical protein Bbelb_375990 [Branchiostoma belcheri]
MRNCVKARTLYRKAKTSEPPPGYQPPPIDKKNTSCPEIPLSDRRPPPAHQTPSRTSDALPLGETCFRPAERACSVSGGVFRWDVLFTCPETPLQDIKTPPPARQTPPTPLSDIRRVFRPAGRDFSVSGGAFRRDVLFTCPETPLKRHKTPFWNSDPPP